VRLAMHHTVTVYRSYVCLQRCAVTDNFYVVLLTAGVEYISGFLECLVTGHALLAQDVA
jgi:hypothetical protein